MVRRYPRLCTALFVLLLIALGHGWSINQGLYLDDHSHYQSLLDKDWSLQSAVDSSRLGILGDVLDVWNCGAKGLKFFRPIAFWTMKAEYTLARFDPLPMHLFNLAWHFAIAMLVASLARRCFGSYLLAALAGALFCVHPAHIAATYWIASQTELMVAAYLLAALLCYANFSRWPCPLFGRAESWDNSDATTRPDYRWLVPAMLFFTLALGCRENAIVFAPLVVLMDLLLRTRKPRWPAYGLITVISASYLALRCQFMQGLALPGPPYLILPSQHGFVQAVFEKFMLYSLALFSYLPIAPMTGLEYLREHPGRFYGSFAGIAVGWALLLWILRDRRGVLLAFLWLILTMLPILPIFEAPHYAYLPSVGMVLILVTALAIGAGWFRRRDAGPVPRSRVFGTGVVAFLHLIGFTAGCCGLGWLYRATWVVENATVSQIASSPRSIRPGDHLFFVNLPLSSWYAVPAYENHTGLRGLHGHALTFSPNPIVVEQPTRLTQLDAYTFRVETTGRDYFAGAQGKVCLELMGIRDRFHQLQTWDAGLYAVKLEHGDTGARALTFRFRSPLTDPSYHFFFGSTEQLAYPIEFPQSASPVAAAGGGNPQ